MVLVMAENFRSLLCRAAWQRCTEFLAVRRSCADCVFTSERARSVRFLAVAQPAARSKSTESELVRDLGQIWDERAQAGAAVLSRVKFHSPTEQVKFKGLVV